MLASPLVLLIITLFFFGSVCCCLMNNAQFYFSIFHFLYLSPQSAIKRAPTAMGGLTSLLPATLPFVIPSLFLFVFRSAWIKLLLKPAYFFLAPQPPYTLSTMAQDAVNLLNHLRVPRAHCVGVSMGGMIAQLLAIHHPSRVQSLVSIMSNTGNRHWKFAPRLSFLLPFLAQTPPAAHASIEERVAFTCNMRTRLANRGGGDQSGRTEKSRECSKGLGPRQEDKEKEEEEKKGEEDGTDNGVLPPPVTYDGMDLYASSWREHRRTMQKTGKERQIAAILSAPCRDKLLHQVLADQLVPFFNLA